MCALRKFLLFFCLLLSVSVSLQAQSLISSVEYGATLHTGDNTPLWQASHQHGLSSIDNNTYLRGGVFYRDTINSWRFNTGLDLVAAGGFTSAFTVHQAYVDVRYKWLGVSVGSREFNPSPLNHQLSSGGMSWSGNARPIPQFKGGLLDYTRLLPFLELKAEGSYGWFTDNNYHKKEAGKDGYYTKSIKYHHKSLFIRVGTPKGRILFEGGYTLDNQFGGYKMERGVQTWDLGNRFKDYVETIFPQGGGDDGPEGEKYFKGNFTGNEHYKFSYRGNTFLLSAYIENYFEDFSSMGKLNGVDGLWGLEYSTKRKQLINALVLEYLQTTNQSGPLHGLEDSPVKKTGGADEYYNHYIYEVGWSHWGMAMGNPLLRSPVYNRNNNLSFLYNRVKAVHLGWSGVVTDEWTYRAKLTYNQTFGTVYNPTLDILENYSTFVEATYVPKSLKGWVFCASTSFDTGDIYGDNWGVQLKINKKF